MSKISHNKGFRLLIADDSLVSRHLLDSTLKKWGYDVRAVADGAEAWNLLQSEDAPDLAILDWMMPGLTGPEVCKLVRQQEREKYTYLILLTSKSLKEDLIEGMESGADDYVTKPFDQHELQVRLRAGIRILDLHAKLQEQASKDQLTMLWNRRSILEGLERELARIKRQDSALGVIMVDLDHFKSVNDTYGHLAGDEVLRESGRRLQASVRAYDLVGRYGGEEFLVILPGCGGIDIENQAERLRLALCDTPISTGEQLVTVTGSFGATFALPAHEVTPHDLIRHADEALYRAKGAGRNQVYTMRHEFARDHIPVAS